MLIFVCLVCGIRTYKSRTSDPSNSNLTLYQIRPLIVVTFEVDFLLSSKSTICAVVAVIVSINV